MNAHLSPLDRLITGFDLVLRTLAAPPRSLRPVPGNDLPDAAMSDTEKRHVAALMRVNHVGEVCAQALYQGQALTSRNERVRRDLAEAAREETEHLAWTLQRIQELGGRTSFLNPLWYAGSLGMGVLAGLAGDKWNLGFLAETERQVEAHLQSHMDKVPANDQRSRAILQQMKYDEMSHARKAIDHGAADLPVAVKLAMRAASTVMTRTAYWV